MTATICAVTPVAARFRFSDDNPLTLEPYARSRFDDLPGYAQDVVENRLGVKPAAWDALVDQGEAYGTTGYRRAYSITGWLRSTRQHRHGTPPSGVCAECWGTCVELDTDGSLTGTVDQPVVCFCADPRRVVYPVIRERRTPTGPFRDGWPGAPRDCR